MLRGSGSKNFCLFLFFSEDLIGKIISSTGRGRNFSISHFITPLKEHQ